jgi:hypothetical protein
MTFHGLLRRVDDINDLIKVGTLHHDGEEYLFLRK